MNKFEKYIYKGTVLEERIRLNNMVYRVRYEMFKAMGVYKILNFLNRILK